MVKIFRGLYGLKDNSGFYYQRYDTPEEETLVDINEQPKLMFHTLGTNQIDDTIIYENPAQPRYNTVD